MPKLMNYMGWFWIVVNLVAVAWKPSHFGVINAGVAALLAYQIGRYDRD